MMGNMTGNCTDTKSGITVKAFFDGKQSGRIDMTDIVYGEVFNVLPEEKRSELVGRKAGFAEKAGISL